MAIVAVVLFFGWRQLPDMSHSLGRSLPIFKTEVKSTQHVAREQAHDVRTEITAVEHTNRHPSPIPTKTTKKERPDVA